MDALHFVAIAWDRVSLATIVNCFRKCGVLKPAVATSQGREVISDWDKLSGECFTYDLVATDNDLMTCGLHTIEDVHEFSTSQLEASSSNNGRDNSDEQQPMTAETLHALSIMRRAMAPESVPRRYISPILQPLEFPVG